MKAKKSKKFKGRIATLKFNMEMLSGQSTCHQFVIVQRKYHTMDNKVTFNMDEIRKLEVIHKVERKQVTGEQAIMKLAHLDVKCITK